MPNFTVVALKCGLTAPKIVKMVIFGINLTVMENNGVGKKVEYRCTTTNLPLYNDTMF